MTKARDLADNTQNTKPKVVDAKGDLIAATGADTANRLAVGANGETLVADSSTSTGLRYTAGTVSENPVLNSAFQVAQRGTSIAVNTGISSYTLDRWMYGAGTNGTVTRQSTNDTTNLPFIQYCARVQRNSGQTGTAAHTFSQSLETVNSIPFVGKTVTMSFYARAGANYSPTSSALAAALYSGTSTDGNVQTGPWTGIATVANSTVSLTTTWQRFSFSGTVSSSATQLGVYFLNNPTGTAGAADFYEVTGVQLDVGSVALPFRTNQPTIATELAACQRYYYRTSADSSGSDLAIGQSATVNDARIVFYNPVSMRVAPTALEQSGTAGDYSIREANAIHVCTSVPVFYTASKSVQSVTLVATGLLTAGRANSFRAVNTSAFLGWSAEL
jgi:hypothetical protein